MLGSVGMELEQGHLSPIDDALIYRQQTQSMDAGSSDDDPVGGVFVEPAGQIHTFREDIGIQGKNCDAGVLFNLFQKHMCWDEVDFELALGHEHELGIPMPLVFSGEQSVFIRVHPCGSVAKFLLHDHREILQNKFATDPHG